MPLVLYTVQDTSSSFNQTNSAYRATVGALAYHLDVQGEQQLGPSCIIQTYKESNSLDPRVSFRLTRRATVGALVYHLDLQGEQQLGALVYHLYIQGEQQLGSSMYHLDIQGKQ